MLMLVISSPGLPDETGTGAASDADAMRERVEARKGEGRLSFLFSWRLLDHGAVPVRSELCVPAFRSGWPLAGSLSRFAAAMTERCRCYWDGKATKLILVKFPVYGLWPPHTESAALSRGDLSRR
jgi:hypothetical protein